MPRVPATSRVERADGRLDDLELARTAADAAGQRLLEVRRSGPEGKALGAAGDAAAEDVLRRLLARHRPGDAVLSEESADDPSRLAADRVWIVDPLDGTREFNEPGRVDWAVHVALWERGGLTTGAVALPALGRVLLSAPPGPLPARESSRPLRLAVSRSRPPSVSGALADALGAELVPLGSAGYKACSVLLGATDAYVHAGGQHEWDSAAPVAVLAAAGAWTSRIDGSPLRYNQRDPYLPDLLVCRPELAEPVLDALSRIDSESRDR